MSHRYSPAHKELVLRLFKDAFKKDVMETVRYTRVPERTLRDWLYAARRAEASRRAAAAQRPAPKRQS
jgi:hypothetical protein